MKILFLLLCCFSFSIITLKSKAIDINPYPRQLIKNELIKTDIKHWKNNNNCIVKSKKDNLIVEMTGPDPSIKLENISSDKPIKISFRAKSTGKGSGQFFWKTDESDFEEQEKSKTFNMVRNGKWHDYSVILPVKGHINSLRFDTASGYCAIYAHQLLRIAYYTGDKKALAAGLKTLDYMSRFRTPRGSQTWEIPLHTPDILASGRITKSYILAYKLTSNKKYLKEARKWAISGIPFVYLWGNQPIMEYATIAVLGATGWTAPNWIGLPVQWCGLVYADAILDLAEFDKTIDWEKLAKGIFICGEQMQYFDGKTIGTLPDSFTLKTQTRNIYDIGPLMLIQFQRIFAGKPTGIYVASDEKNIIISPFPVKIKHGEAIINAKKDFKYQVIINQKVKNIKSEGKDIIKF